MSTSLVQRRAVARGAALALSVMVPTIVAIRVLDATVGIDEQSNALFLPYLGILAALVAGGRMAGRDQPEAGLVHGALAAGAAYLLIAVVGVVASVVAGDVPNVAALMFQAMLSMSAGLLGGLLSVRRRKARTGPGSPGDQGLRT